MGRIQRPLTLDLGGVNRVLPRRPGMGKAAAGHEIDVDRQPPLRGIEIDGSPRTG